MIKRIGLGLAMGVLLLSVGCKQILTRPARVFLDAVGGDYVTYVSNDESLDDREKRIRLQHVESFANAVTAAESLD